MKPIKARKKASQYFTIIRNGLSNTPRQRMGFISPTEGVYIYNMLFDIAGRGEYITSYKKPNKKQRQNDNEIFAARAVFLPAH